MHPEYQPEEPTKKQNYSEETLRKYRQATADYVNFVKNLLQDDTAGGRCVNFPCEISENMVRFIIMNKEGDETVTRECVGDLRSDRKGKIEVKCFASTGPISFSPKPQWNVIYFLDAKKWISDDHYVCWRCDLGATDERWQGVMINKTTTFATRAGAGTRPRIKWTALYPQISEFCTKIYEGSFEGVFTRSDVGPVAGQSDGPPEPTPRSPPVCTGVSPPEPEACTSEETPEN